MTPAAAAQAETRTLAELARSWSPDVFVDVHSGDRFVAMPCAPFDRSYAPARIGTQMSDLARISQVRVAAWLAEQRDAAQRDASYDGGRRLHDWEAASAAARDG